MPKFDRQTCWIVFGGLFLASLGALVVFAIQLLRLYCESFGCIGVGVAWFAWCVAFTVVLGCGVLLRRKLQGNPRLLRACRARLWLQTLLGIALLAYYVWHRL